MKVIALLVVAVVRLGWKQLLTLATLAATLMVWTATPASRAEPQHPPVPLRCRLEGGPWQDCRMTVEGLGERWSLLVGSERLSFEHDGRGRVRMQRGSRDWRPVEAQWTADAALCWDGVCAKGEIPLD